MITLPATAVMLAIANDCATWHTVRHYPSMPVIALVIHVVDCAAIAPDWWQVVRWLLIAPGISVADLADCAGVGVCRALDLLKLYPAEIDPPLAADAFIPSEPEAADLYDLRPRDVAGGETAANTLALADWAARHSIHWQVLRLWYSDSDLDLIANLYHITKGLAAACCQPPTKGDLQNA